MSSVRGSCLIDSVQDNFDQWSQEIVVTPKTALLIALSVTACGQPPTSQTTDAGPAPAPICGNGVVEAGEACDDGNDVDTDECLATCVAASCGDGFVYADVEACDDGNLVSDDGCSADCVLERIAIALAWYHSCAVLDSGALRCWGLNFNGPLGDGTTTNRLTPVEVRF
jgi:cysteine-rich repeat protein